MYLREAPTETLADVREKVEDLGEAIQVSNAEVALDLTDSKTITLQTGDGITIPATDEAIQALGAWVDVPSKFLSRLDGEMQQYLLTNLLSRNQGTGQFVLGGPDRGLKQVRKPSTKLIEPRSLVDTALHVIDPSALVLEWRDTQDEFRLDVIAPENFERGIGGDTKVGDLTAGGLRMGLDKKHNLAPWTQTLLYRYFCTNGMSIPDPTLKVEARAQSVEEVLAEFERAADRAFRQAEGAIESFYAMREESVENPERTLLRMATEAGLPDRTRVRLAERIPAMMEQDDTEGTVSMFDLVNLITNQANDPSIRGRSGPRMALEQAGGEVVTSHAERCGRCQSVLSE